MSGSNWIRPELATQIRDVFRATDNVLAAAHTLRHALKPGHVPFGRFEADRWVPTPLAEGQRQYGNTLVFAIWQQLRTIEALRVAFTGKPSEPLAPSVEEPDEAPGLAVEAPTDGDQQPRLTSEPAVH